MKIIKIGFDAHVLDGKHQGTRTTLRSLLQAISDHGDASKIAIYSENTSFAKSLLNNAKFEYRRLPKVNGVLRLLFLFPAIFRRDNVDYGVFQYVSPFFGRNILFIHDILPISHSKLFPLSMRLKALLLFTLSIRRATKIIAVSQFTKSEIEKRLHTSQDKISIVLNGPSFERDAYMSPARDQKEKYILTVGRIERRKNIPLLVEAFVKANIKNVSLVIVGSMDGGFSYRFPDGKNIIVRNNVADEELIEIYRNASMFVYPSSAEGFGLPLLDATLFGIPTISSNKCSLPEVGGDLVDYFDPDAVNAADFLRDRLISHFEGKQVVKSPTIEQRETQFVKFSWDRAGQSFLKIIEEL